MRAEIICLRDKTTDALSFYKSCKIFSSSFSRLGIETANTSFIENTEDAVSNALFLADSRNDIVLVMGASGYNTLCKDILLQSLNCRVQRNKQCAEHMNRQIKELGLTNDAYFEHALFLPDSSEVFPDPNSIFCGFSIRTSNTVFILLPYISQNADKTSNQVMDYLSKIFDIRFSSQTLNIFGVDKNFLESLALKLTRRSKVNYQINEDCEVLSLTITAYASSAKEADTLCKTSVEKFRKELGLDIYSDSIASLSEVTVEALKSHNITVATAESCTGGLLSEKLTTVAGASQIIEIGVCAYSNRIKNDILNVPEHIIDTFGAVSKETACYMAKGIKEKSGSDIAVSITGVAGPASSELKPVGTVYIALYNGKHYWVRGLKLTPSLDRDSVRNISVNTALDLLRRFSLAFPDNMPGLCDLNDISVLYSQPKDNFSDIFPVNTVPIKAATPAVASAVVEHIETDFFGFSNEFEDGFTIDNTVFDQPEEIEITDIKPEKDKKSTKKAKIKENKTKPQKTPLKLRLLLFSVISIVLVAAIIMSGYFFASQKQNNLTKSLTAVYKENSGEEAYSILKEKNSDYAAWLMSKNEEISLPVCHSDNNDYYLERNFLGNKSTDGTLFFDKKCVLDKQNPSSNLIVYGKNLKKGNMFSGLIKYESISYLSENNIFILDFGAEKITYQIFAVLIMNADAKDDNDYIFPFTKSNFSSAKEFEVWMEEINTRSIISTDIQVSETDKLLTLSTNYNAFDNARFVVMAKQVSTIQAANYTVNANPKYPQVWYDLKGIDNPFNLE